MDLVITFVPYLSYDSLCSLFELIKELLEVQNSFKFHILCICRRSSNTGEVILQCVDYCFDMVSWAIDKVSCL